MLYLIRHSIVVQQPEVSSHSWQLSAAGRLKASQLAKHLPKPPGFVYTSGEPKAYETGKAIAAEWGIACQTAAGLQEQQRHKAPYFDTLDQFQAAITNLFDHPNELVLGEETAVQARTRFSQAVSHLVEQHPTQTIAIVTHGTVLSLFVAWHNPNVNIHQFWRGLTMPDCYALTLPDFTLQQRITSG